MRAVFSRGGRTQMRLRECAGYTLWRLNVKRFDAADTEHYYQAVGDDYVGAQDSHGTGTQRTTAFQEGWDLARTGAREDSGQRPAGGLD